MRCVRRQRVVLYNPKADQWTMPLALLALASNLDRSRFEPVIIDGRLEDAHVQAVLEGCDDALVFACSVLSGSPIEDAATVTRAAKRHRPDLPVIWGGWHPSILPESCLDEPGVDLAVRGQGEAVFNDIVEGLADGSSPADLPGCVTRAPGGGFRTNPQAPLVDPNTFPAVNYGLIDVERYFRRKGKRQLDFISSIGCRFRCSFCADPSVYGRQWMGLEPERIAHDLERAWNRWRFDDVSFQDETFFTSEARVAGVAEQFLERDLECTWAATMRADQGARLPEEVFALCARSGLRRVIVGVESASQEGLERFRKDITLEQVHISAQRCAQHRIGAIFPFIVGLPDESLADVQAAVDLALDLRSMSDDFSTPFFFYQPYPGTDLGEELEKEGFETPRSLEEWARFDFVGTAGSWVSPAVQRLAKPFVLRESSS